MFDMAQCKPGDKLLLRDGTTAVFQDYKPNRYPYNIIIGGNIHTRDEFGYAYFKGRDQTKDVVGFYTESTSNIPIQIVFEDCKNAVQGYFTSREYAPDSLYSYIVKLRKAYDDDHALYSNLLESMRKVIEKGC